MSGRQPKSKTQSVEEVSTYQSKDEMNLAEFPVVKLGSRDKREVIIYEAWVKDESGERQKRKWEVRGAAGIGLPDEFGDRVMVALMTMTAQQGFHSPKVSFSEYQLLKILGLTDGKRNYQALEKVLNQLVGITIYSRKAFWDNAKKRRVTNQEAFHLVEKFWLRKWEEDDEKRESEDSSGYIVWSDTFWQSFQSGYIKNLNLPFYLSLDNAIARRLYRFLDKWMHYRDECEIDIFDLGGRLGMVRYKYPSEVKKKLQPGFDELIRQGYLAEAEVYKKGKFTRVRFVKAASQPWSDIPNLFSIDQSDANEDSENAAGNRSNDAEAALTGELILQAVIGVNEPWRPFYEVYGTNQGQHDTWDAVLNSLSMSMPQSTYQQYLEGTQLLSIDGNEAVVGVLHATLKDWLKNRMAKKILKALSEQLEEKLQSIEFVSIDDLRLPIDQGT